MSTYQTPLPFILNFIKKRSYHRTVPNDQAVSLYFKKGIVQAWTCHGWSEDRMQNCIIIICNHNCKVLSIWFVALTLYEYTVCLSSKSNSLSRAL